MDELALVSRLRDDVPAGADLAGPERRLVDEIAAAAVTASRARGPRASRAGAKGWKRGYGRIAAAGAVAAAIAAAAVVVVVQGHATPGRGPGHHRASTSTAAGIQAWPLPGGSPRPAASAAQLVDYATRAAAAAPRFDPKPHDWIYTKTLDATSSAGEGGMLFGSPDGRAVEQSWLRVDGRQTAYLSHGKLVVSRLLPRGAVGPTPGGWPNITYRYLDSLPSSPASLKAVIEACESTELRDRLGEHRCVQRDPGTAGERGAAAKAACRPLRRAGE